MATSRIGKLAQHLRKTMLVQEVGDGQLLDSFISSGDEAALETLIRRHGPMVWSVCSRVLHNHHDTEDAFQATFLVLVRKATAIVPRSMVANWLYGVAHQTALKARAKTARQKGREKQVMDMPEPESPQQDLWNDVQPILDQELSALPDKYRAVVVLCDLEGKTRKEAARQLGWPEGTVAGRLARARARLAKRLVQRGVALSGASLAVVMSQKAASASVPAVALSSTIKSVTLAAAGQTATALIPAKVAALTSEMMKAMLLTKLKNVAVALLLIVLVGGGGMLTYRLATAEQVKPDPPAATAASADNKSSGRDPHRDLNAQRLAINPRNPDNPRIVAGLRFQQVLVDDDDGGGVVYAVSYSPDGKILAVARGYDLVNLANAKVNSKLRPIRLWDGASGKKIATLEGHTEVVLCIAFSPDGKKLASGGHDDTIRLWDIASGKNIATLPGHIDPTRRIGDWVPKNTFAVTFSPDGKTLASAGIDGKIKLWDVATSTNSATLDGHGGTITSVVYSPDGKMLAATGWYSPTIKLWDVAGKKCTGTLESHARGVGSAAFSPDGKILASAGLLNDRIQLWDVTNGKNIASLDGHSGGVNTVVFSPDGKTLASAGKTRDSIPDGWDATSTMSPDGRPRGPAGGFKGSTLKLWDVAGGKIITTIQEPTTEIRSLAFSPDGRTLTTGGDDSRIRSWEIVLEGESRSPADSGK